MRMSDLIACEIEYLKCCCRVFEDNQVIRCQDDHMPDMHHHNFTWIKETVNDEELKNIIEGELRSCSEHKDFCLIRCRIPISSSLPERLFHKPDLSTAAEYYLADISGMPKQETGQTGNLIKFTGGGMAEDLLKLDMEHDGEILGHDFCIRRASRRKDIYLSNKGVDSYIYYVNGEPVGNCDLFLRDKFGKIENFAISPQKQRKGYGTAILLKIMGQAYQEGGLFVYLETERDGTAKEIYMKNGFRKVYEFTDLFFQFRDLS